MPQNGIDELAEVVRITMGCMVTTTLVGLTNVR